jgi:tetratricopeptide (TPR) repeat protein
MNDIQNRHLNLEPHFEHMIKVAIPRLLNSKQHIESWLKQFERSEKSRNIFQFYQIPGSEIVPILLVITNDQRSSIYDKLKITESKRKKINTIIEKMGRVDDPTSIAALIVDKFPIAKEFGFKKLHLLEKDIKAELSSNIRVDTAKYDNNLIPKLAAIVSKWDNEEEAIKALSRLSIATRNVVSPFLTEFWTKAVCRLKLSDRRTLEIITDIAQVIRISEKTKEAISLLHDEDEAASRYLLATILLGENRFNEAEKLYKKVYEIIDKSLKPFLQVDFLTKIGKVKARTGDSLEAEKMIQSAYEISKKLGDNQLIAVSLSNIAEYQTDIGNTTKALESYKLALSLFDKVGDRRSQAATKNSIARIRVDKKDYDKALKYLESSLKICREIGDKFGEGATLSNIGNIFYARDDYETALKYLESSLKISKEIGDKAEEGTTLNNISAIYRTRGDYETALKCLESSLKISREIGNKTGQIPTLHNMAMIEYRKENNQRMFELEMQAYQLALETQDAMGLFQVGQVFGQLLFGSGQKKEGIAMVRRAYDIGKQNGLQGTEEIKALLKKMEESM